MSTTRAIPVSLKDRSDIDFSTSLGGTLYGTTPGGTKIVYDRNALLQYRNSPLSKTPPPQLAHITNTELNKKVEKSTTTPTTTTPPTTTAKPKPTNDDGKSPDADFSTRKATAILSMSSNDEIKSNGKLNDKNEE
ncbi:hypothetical protein ACTFIR_003377 [Dictyostelium discoideum]